LSTSTAIILAGGLSQRFGSDKALAELGGRPLIQYVTDVVTRLVDETIIVVGTSEQESLLSRLYKGRSTMIMDTVKEKSPLVGASIGFERAHGTVSLLLPCDAPLLSGDVLSFLLGISPSYNAVIPRWPNGNIEPIHATYNTGTANAAAKEALRNNELRMYDAIKRLRNVLYVSTDILRQLDPNLHTFMNINTREDLHLAEQIVKCRLATSTIAKSNTHTDVSAT